MPGLEELTRDLRSHPDEVVDNAIRSSEGVQGLAGMIVKEERDAMREAAMMQQAPQNPPTIREQMMGLPEIMPTMENVPMEAIQGIGDPNLMAMNQAMMNAPRNDQALSEGMRMGAGAVEDANRNALLNTGIAPLPAEADMFAAAEGGIVGFQDRGYVSAPLGLMTGESYGGISRELLDQLDPEMRRILLQRMRDEAASTLPVGPPERALLSGPQIPTTAIGERELLRRTGEVLSPLGEVLSPLPQKLAELDRTAQITETSALPLSEYRKLADATLESMAEKSPTGQALGERLASSPGAFELTRTVLAGGPGEEDVDAAIERFKAMERDRIQDSPFGRGERTAGRAVIADLKASAEAGNPYVAGIKKFFSEDPIESVTKEVIDPASLPQITPELQGAISKGPGVFRDFISKLRRPSSGTIEDIVGNGGDPTVEDEGDTRGTDPTWVAQQEERKKLEAGKGGKGVGKGDNIVGNGGDPTVEDEGVGKGDKGDGKDILEEVANAGNEAYGTDFWSADTLRKLMLFGGLNFAQGKPIAQSLNEGLVTIMEDKTIRDKLGLEERKVEALMGLNRERIDARKMDIRSRIGERRYNMLSAKQDFFRSVLGEQYTKEEMYNAIINKHGLEKLQEMGLYTDPFWSWSEAKKVPYSEAPEKIKRQIEKEYREQREGIAKEIGELEEQLKNLYSNEDS